jgi:hypothetical protein
MVDNNRIETYLDELIKALKEDTLNSDYLARTLTNYITAKEGLLFGTDIICETIVTLSTTMSDSDKHWCVNKIKRFIN